MKICHEPGRFHLGEKENREKNTFYSPDNDDDDGT